MMDGNIIDPQTWPFGDLIPRHYGVIYADPPWRFLTRSPKGMGRSPDRHYPTMTLAEIKALPIAELAARDCVLLMWATGPHLENAFDVLRVWGFKYKSLGFLWAKTTRSSNPSWAPMYNMGGGYWTRANAEPVLLAVRGKPKRKARGVRQLIVAPLREHSRKPDLHDDIERLVPGPYCELFARQRRPGWDVWGNEVDKFGRAA